MMVYGKENNTAIPVKTFATLNRSPSDGLLHLITYTCSVHFPIIPLPFPPGQSVVAQAKNYRKIF